MEYHEEAHLETKHRSKGEVSTSGIAGSLAGEFFGNDDGKQLFERSKGEVRELSLIHSGIPDQHYSYRGIVHPAVKTTPEPFLEAQ
jgi:hypothetical protein